MSTVSAPVFERTHEQQLAALRRANEIRFARAQLKRDLRTGTANAGDVIADPPAWAASMRIRQLLEATPKFGVVKTRRLLNQARVADSKTIGGLSRRQRTELVTLLGAGR